MALPAFAYEAALIIIPPPLPPSQVYNESCHDLYQKGDAVRANLPIYEDDMEGYQVGTGGDLAIEGRP